MLFTNLLIFSPLSTIPCIWDHSVGKCVGMWLWLIVVPNKSSILIMPVMDVGDNVDYNDEQN